MKYCGIELKGDEARVIGVEMNGNSYLAHEGLDGELQLNVAQGRTITETLEIARDVVKKLIEAQSG